MSHFRGEGNPYVDCGGKRGAYTPVPASSFDNSSRDLLHSVKIWDLAKILDQRSARKPVTIKHKSPKKDKPANNVTELIRLLQTEVRKQSPQRSPEMRLRQKLRFTKRSTLPSRPRRLPSLQMTLPPSSGESTQRPRATVRSGKKKQTGLLQPLRVTGFRGASDPCFHVVNYVGGEVVLTRAESTERRSAGLVQSSTPEPLPPPSECVGSSMKLSQPQAPRHPHNYYREKQGKSKAFWRVTRLEGWNTASRDVSPRLSD